MSGDVDLAGGETRCFLISFQFIASGTTRQSADLTGSLSMSRSRNRDNWWPEWAGTTYATTHKSPGSVCLQHLIKNADTVLNTVGWVQRTVQTSEITWRSLHRLNQQLSDGRSSKGTGLDHCQVQSQIRYKNIIGDLHPQTIMGLHRVYEGTTRRHLSIKEEQHSHSPRPSRLTEGSDVFAGLILGSCLVSSLCK